MSQIIVDEDAIRALAKLMDETGLTEIEVSEGEKNIRVAKQNNVVMGAPLMGAIPQMMAGAAPAGGSAPAAAAEGTLKSPMVGTVYMQASPDSPPFITPGATVKQGDTLLIIEAMKVMNPIKAAKSGTVKQIFVDNAQPVEFGEALLVLE